MREIILSKNQIELLNIIQSFRFMPQKAVLDMARMLGLYRYRQSLGVSVRKLEKVEYVRSFLYGNNWKVLYITSKGADRLSFELGISKNDIHVPGRNKKVQFSTLEHTVEVSRIFNQVMDTVRSQEEVELVKWVGDQCIRCKYSLRIPTGKKITKYLVPDSYFILKHKGIEIPYFLEYDTGSMDFEQLALKYQRYFEYFYYGDYKERFGQFPTTIFVTKRSENKLNNLLQNPDTDLDSALRNRKLLTNSKNLLWSGIGKTPNIRSINSQKIKEFLNLNLKFYLYKNEWIKDLLK